MKIIRASDLGFCMGVRRAVELAVAAAPSRPGERVYTLGALIHNPKVLAQLEGLGVKTLDFAQNAPPLENAVVIIRAHGISPLLEKELRESCYRVVDATCPKVKKNQLAAARLVKEGFRLFIAGEGKHAEIEGILGYANSEGAEGKALVVENAEGARQSAAELYEKDRSAKTAIIAQTTISEAEYSAIALAIKQYFPKLKIAKSICGATKARQQSLKKLLPQVDAVVVAGGKGSANTRRLLAIAEAGGKPAIIAEDALDLPAHFSAFETVGLCAGASTPDCVIGEIELSLKGRG
ncbi:MAG: 4-hydroxy-3-methylbut-2-enyl diphosphate reductase [Spirochaetes bacterium]|nr:4-hydroxy-3-methylbut-2-enyl diphosphate reductase [Spirochaetota bacterium]